MEVGREFLEKHLKFTGVTEYEVAAINLLLYHSFGPSKKKPVDTSSIIYKLLQDDGMSLFKSIFDNNSNDTVKKFFTHPFVKKLWPTIFKYFTVEIVFGKTQPNEEIEMTYRDITR